MKGNGATNSAQRSAPGTEPSDGSIGFGGGQSPVRQSQPIKVGALAMWEAEGYLTTSPIAPGDPNLVTEAPTDGLAYARRGYDHAWVPVASDLGVSEAPIDGRTYTRDGALQAWLPLPYVIPEAPLTGQGYVRNGLNQTWQPALTQDAADARYAPRTTVSFPEAPNDGIAYARRGWDRTWIPVATGTGLPEAPPTGLTYVRDGLNERWVLAFTQAQAQAQGDARYAPIATVSFPEAPPDGQVYMRNGMLRQWQPALTEAAASLLYAPIWTVSFPEAPTDGRSYARRGADHSWQVIPAVQDWITDAPADGQFYVRDGLLHSWVSVQQQDLDGGVWGPDGGAAGSASTALGSGPAGVGSAPAPFSSAYYVHAGLALQWIAVRALVLNIGANIRSWQARIGRSLSSLGGLVSSPSR